MSSEGQSKHLRSLSEIRRVLLLEWDPMGIKDDPEAADEYDSYAGDVWLQLEKGASVDEVAEYLWKLEVAQMFLPGNKDATRRIAARLVELHAEHISGRRD